MYIIRLGANPALIRYRDGSSIVHKCKIGRINGKTGATRTDRGAGESVSGHMCVIFRRYFFGLWEMGVKLQDRKTYHMAGISSQISVLYAERTGRIVT